MTVGEVPHPPPQPMVGQPMMEDVPCPPSQPMVAELMTGGVSHPSELKVSPMVGHAMMTGDNVVSCPPYEVKVDLMMWLAIIMTGDCIVSCPPSELKVELMVGLAMLMRGDGVVLRHSTELKVGQPLVGQPLTCSVPRPTFPSSLPLPPSQWIGRIKEVLFLYACPFFCFFAIGVANLELSLIHI